MDSKQVIHGKYFPHIDGIRTIAVLSVVIYHIFGNLCPGGFVGVDIFFVISGYLITGGILKSLDQGKFSLKDFYERRIRRIIPAYVVLIGFVMLFSLILPPDLMGRTFKTSAFSSIFSTNIFLRFTPGGYFDSNAETNPLLHLWSLGVEEQFYIFTPIFLFFVYKINKKLILHSLLLIVGLSLALSLYCNHIDAYRFNFYMLPTRTWELMAGSLFAYWNKTNPSSNPRRGAIRALGAIGIIISLLVCYSYDSYTIFPGITAIPPVLGALLMIRWGNIGISRLILESKIFVQIGKISYSLYLWHWPLIVYWKYVSDEPDNTWGLLGVLSISLTIAWLSWRFIEIPIRLSSKWNLKRALLWVLIGCGSIGATSCVFIHIGLAKQWSTFWTTTNPFLESYWEGESPDESDPYLISQDMGYSNPSSKTIFILGSNQNPSYLLWGDSHAVAISPGFHEFSKNTGINGIFLNKRIYIVSRLQTNNIYIDNALEFIRKKPEIKTVVLINKWKHDPDICFFGNKFEDKFDHNLQNICKRLKEIGKNIILISPVPEQNIDIPSKCYLHNTFKKTPLHGIHFNKFMKRQKSTFITLKKIEQANTAKVLWINHFFFPTLKHSTVADNNNSPFYQDNNHLNPTGAKELINYYNDELLRLFKRDDKNIHE